MRKEEIRGLIIYSIMIIVAIIVGFTVIKPLMESYGPDSKKMGSFLFLIIVVIVAYLFNVIGLEFLHVIGCAFGGYKVTAVNVLGLCLTKTDKNWKLTFKDFNGVSGETTAYPKKEKLNPNLMAWFPLFGYAVELATSILIISFIKGAKYSSASWLAPASMVFLLISSMLAFYNFVPLKLDSITDGYKMRLFLKPVNVEAYNEMLRIEEQQRTGKKIENIRVFSEITEFTAEINTKAIYMYLEQEKFNDAELIIDQLLENKKVISQNDANRLIAQKMYVTILTKTDIEAKKIYNEICTTEIRRFIANDISMQSIRAYILIAGILENSESEVLYAKSKLQKARKRALKSEIKTEEFLVEKALDCVYGAHESWAKENASL